jgi:hypothetical protein
MKVVLHVFIFSLSALCISQKLDVKQEFEDHLKFPHETAYAHLNKTVLIQGEQLAFTAYVFDRINSGLNKQSKNLYCKIIDENGEDRYEKALLVDNGMSSHVIDIDSSFAAGNYKLLLYTNWMKNQNDDPEFVSRIRILNKYAENASRSIFTESSDLDIDIFPEGGKLIANIQSCVGISIRDKFDNGIEINNGVITENGMDISKFETDKMGLGRFYFTPDSNKSYTLKFEYLETVYERIIQRALEQGLSINVSTLPDNVTVTISTSIKSLESVKGSYKLAISNDRETGVTDFEVSKETNFILIPKRTLGYGVNEITLFNNEGNVILQRMVFNHNELPLVKLPIVERQIKSDSIEFNLKWNDEARVSKRKSIGKLSISVLPLTTKLLNRNQDLKSRFHFNTHVSDLLYTSDYYLKRIDRREKYDIDNLMLTHARSTINWNALYSLENLPIHQFENGIKFSVKFKPNKYKQFVVFPMGKSETQIIDIEEEGTTFNGVGFYPKGDDSFQLGAINKRGNSTIPKVYPVFEPVKIPDYDSKIKLPDLYPLENSSYLSALSAIDISRQLDTIIIKTSEQTRKEEIMKKHGSFNTVNVITENERTIYTNVLDYLQFKNVRSIITDGRARILPLRGQSSLIISNSPIIFLDDVRIDDATALLGIPIFIVDYILINRSGLGDPAPFTDGGTIRIYTGGPSKLLNRRKEFSEYDVPMTFAENRKYTPTRFIDYNSIIFKELGVVGFLPSVDLSKDGTAQFKVRNLNLKGYLLVIEGFLDDGTAISYTIPVE